MNFYFCETCGKRLTEDQIKEGAACDKKLRGVYCKACAVGVSTMDVLPLTPAEARKLLEKAAPPPSSPPVSPAAEPRRLRSRSSGVGLPTGTGGLKPERRSSARELPLKPARLTFSAGFGMIVGALVAVMVTVVGVLVWSAGGSVPIERSSASKKSQTKIETHSASVLKGPSQQNDRIGSTAEGQRSGKSAETSAAAEALSSSDPKRSALRPDAPGSEKPAPEEHKASADTSSAASPASPPTPDGVKNAKDAPVNKMKTLDDDARLEKPAPPEPHGPAPDNATSKTHAATPKPDDAAKLAKTAFDEHLKVFDVAVFRGDLVAARAAAERAQADPALKGVEQVAREVASLVGLAQQLTTAAASRQRAREALGDGKKRTFRTPKGAVTGVLDKIEGDTLTVRVTGQINKQAIEYKQRVNLSELTPACRESVLGEKVPATPEEWLAEMFRNLAAKELKQAAQALAKASAHPLAEHYLETLPELRLGVVATGGTVTDYTQDGKNYRVHTFTSSGTFTVTQGGSVDYLVIGGGGGGGGDYSGSHWTGGGGGGAGGYRSSVAGESSGGGATAEAPLTLSVGTYTIAVGDGGAGGSPDNNGANGSDSYIQTLPAVDLVRAAGGGGGAGGKGSARSDGNAGGSGGGGAGNNGSVGGAGAAAQGHPGGDARINRGSGGGGGAAGAGAISANPGTDVYGKNYVKGHGGTGGPGIASRITGSSVRRAGGGGGGCDETNNYQPGCGADGGGDGIGQHGTAHTGGGGGGGDGSNSGTGGNGGSGIVIVRYVTGETTTAGDPGRPTLTPPKAAPHTPPVRTE